MRRRTDALDAVARVRRVREQDSLAGLRQATREVDDAQRRVSALEARLLLRASAAPQDTAGFVAARTGLLAVEQAATAAQSALVAARNLAVSAQAHWEHDKSRLEAIEMLQDRRAQEARAEELRDEARELDEVAAQLWQRRRRLEVVR
jgi:flagellar export protein FliJ